MIRDGAQERVYRVCDDDGRFLGRIVEPCGAAVFGPHAGTVLLARDIPRLLPSTSFREPSAA